MARISLIRVTFVAVALVVCAWFAIGIRQAHDTAKASAIVLNAQSLSAAQVKHVDSLLHSASFLNPDRQVSVLRAQAAQRHGDLKLAQAILRGVVHAEPQNAPAWIALARASTTRRMFIEAAVVLAHLVPPVPR
jgi:predicted Zn-dependent protease